MARPKRTDTEALRSRMRTVALMQELTRRVGADNPNQFAKWFDTQADATTQESGKWRHNFNGNRPLSEQQLNWLCKFPETSDAHKAYWNGPADLWLAMWNDPRELWPLCRTRQHETCPDVDHEVWQAEYLDTGRKVNDRCLRDVLREFEGELLMTEAYGEMLHMRHLTEAIALYRIYQYTNSCAWLDDDATSAGAYRCVRMCADDCLVKHELNNLGIYDLVVSELESNEVQHLACYPTYRACIPLPDEIIDTYIRNPLAAYPESDRWDALNFDWAP
jgi:hypothetical protein